MPGHVNTRQLVLFGIFFVLLYILAVTVAPGVSNTTTAGAKYGDIRDYTTMNILGTQVRIDAAEAVMAVKNDSIAEAVMAVKNDSIAAAFMDVKFTTPARRIQKVSLILENGSLDSRYLWYVELAERSCYCGGDQDLYVVKRFVDPADGRVVNVSIATVLESQYSKNICAGSCH